MSLRQLLALRRKGSRPEHVNVIIGRPASFDDGPGIAVVERADEDLSPLMGLPVHVVDLAGDAALTLAVIHQLETLSVRPVGICGPVGACGVSPEHEQAMRLYREALCRTE